MFRLPRQFFFTRLLLTLGIMLSLLGAVFLARAQSALETLSTRTLPGIEIAADIKRVPDLLYSTALCASLLDPSAERTALLRDFHANLARFSPLLEKYRETVVAPEDARLLSQVEADFATFRSRVTGFAESNRGQADAVPALHAAFRKFDDAAQELYDFRSGRAGMWADKSLGAARRAIAITLAGAVTLALVFLGILLRLAALRVRPESPGNF